MSGLRAKGLGLREGAGLKEGQGLRAARTWRSVGLAALLAALYVVSGRTQQQPPPPQPTFRTEANYVRVDVYPTKDGAPVPDLTKDDFQILESGQPQQIEQFERVEIRGNLPQELRREPNSVAEAREAARNPRARVFVVFLDTGHVDVAGSHNIRRPLIDTLNRVIGEDDLVAVMTPDMTARDITFARRTTTIEGFLAKHWPWGDRDKLNPTDPVEQNYEQCYGPARTTPLTAEMIERHREKQTLDALDDLVRSLRDLREERKAVLAITDGWRLYRPNPGLANAQRPEAPPVGVVPGTGRVTIGDRSNPNVLPTECERDRQTLAYIDDEMQYRRLLDAANRANTSFYPIDPRGLAVFDSPISNPLPLQVDAARLRARADSLRTLAEATDGITTFSNDLAASLRRIVADVSSYYLLGYYSTGTLDGRFHPITVRVKRPGVNVRARRGYLAATPAAATSAARASDGPAGAGDAEAAALAAAIGPLGGYARELPLRLQAAVGWKPGSPPAGAAWVVGELGAAEGAWKGGGAADLELLSPAGSRIADAHLTIAPGMRAFRAALVPAEPLTAGEYVVRVTARPAGATLPFRETLRLAVAADSVATGAVWVRRGLATGNRDAPTADMRFRRNEHLRVEMPTLSSDAGSPRLLDRNGKPLAVPVAGAIRDDVDGGRWRTAQVTLAALAPGDYVIEVGEAGKRFLFAFRIVP